jgi:glycosyltransferase involved in cell wall biosynthesis
MLPLVSVVITTYKGKDSIDRAVRSVLSQTYQNIEIIVVDDNGKGTTDQIATESLVTAISDERLQYIAHEVNKNGSAARNTGINAAKGKYVALLDDDDSFRKDKIEKQLKALEDSECKLCYTGLMIHYLDGRNVVQTQNDHGRIFENVISRKIHAPSSVLMFERSAALEIYGFDDSFKRHQDWEFLDRMANNYEIAVVPDICMDRYIYSRNSAANPEQYELNRRYYLEKMSLYINKLPREKRDEVYDFHYRSICKEYLRSGKYFKAAKKIMLCKHKVNTIQIIIRDYLEYRKH